jgi:hypothetical protein
MPIATETVDLSSISISSPMIPLAAQKDAAAECVPVWSSTASTRGRLQVALEKLKSPQSIGLASLMGVITLWLGSSMLTQDILRSYNKPMLMTFLSVISMQAYFVFLKVRDPLQVYMARNKDSVRMITALQLLIFNCVRVSRIFQSKKLPKLPFPCSLFTRLDFTLLMLA